MPNTTWKRLSTVLLAGGLLALDRSVPHAVKALEDSSLVLTVSSNARARKAAR